MKTMLLTTLTSVIFLFFIPGRIAHPTSCDAALFRWLPHSANLLEPLRGTLLGEYLRLRLSRSQKYHECMFNREHRRRAPIRGLNYLIDRSVLQSKIGVRFEIAPPETSVVVPKARLLPPFFNATRQDAVSMSLNLFVDRDGTLNLFLSSSKSKNAMTRELYTMVSPTSPLQRQASLPAVPRPESYKSTANAAIFFLKEFDVYIAGMESAMYYYKFYISRTLNGTWIRLETCEHDMQSYKTWNQTLDAKVRADETFFYGAMDTSISFFEGEGESIYSTARVTISITPRNFHHRGKRATGVFVLTDLRGAILQALADNSTSDISSGTECVLAKRVAWWGLDNDVLQCHPYSRSAVQLLNLTITEELFQCLGTAELLSLETSQKWESALDRKKRVKQSWSKIVDCFAGQVEGAEDREFFRVSLTSTLECASRTRDEIYAVRVSRISETFYIGAVAIYEPTKGRDPIRLVTSSNGLSYDLSLMTAAGNPFVNLTDHFSTSEVLLSHDHLVSFYSTKEGLVRALWKKYQLGAAICPPGAGKCSLISKPFVVRGSVMLRLDSEGGESVTFEIIARLGKNMSCSMTIADPQVGLLNVEIAKDISGCSKLIGLECYLRVEFASNVKLYTLEIED